MSRTDTYRRRAKAGHWLVSISLLAIALATSLPPAASAHSFVKTERQCTRYGGEVKPLVARKGWITDDGYRFACHTHDRDRLCERKHGNNWYFDAEAGRCEHDESGTSS